MNVADFLYHTLDEQIKGEPKPDIYKQAIPNLDLFVPQIENEMKYKAAKNDKRKKSQ